MTVLRDLRARLPDEDIVYLADQAHVPYGDRPPEELRRLLADNVATLEAAGVDAIVMGCNTSCATAARYGWPPTNVAILDLIEAAADAVAASGGHRVGVLATTATARSGAYGTAIRARLPAVSVEEVAAPALVPLVESGQLESPLTRSAVREACAAFRSPLDTLVLACTHYPLLDAHFAAVLGAGVIRIDPAGAQSERAAAYVDARDRCASRGSGSGYTRYVTTGPRATFVAALEAIVGSLGSRDEVASVLEAPLWARSPAERAAAPLVQSKWKTR